MPGVNFTLPIFRAGAAASTDWGSVEGKVESEFAVGAALKRGLRLEAGLSALAEVDGALAKFLAAQVTGRASAEARVTAQIQLPLNLFDEAGAAVRLQAVAEAAAGVQAGLGLTIGDFVDLARGVFGSEPLPLRLLLLFLEEVDLTAGVYAKVAATAQAQAYASIVGTLRDDPVRGLKPGFNIVAGAGLGLAAGAGVRVFARAGFRDFSRFYARAIDLVVDAVFDETETRLGEAAGPTILAALDAARPPLKTAFRLAYELGDFLATSAPPQNAEGAAALAARAAGVVFEEGQRYLLRNFAVAGTREIRRLLKPRLAALDAAGRNRVKPRRDALIALLRGRPEDLFNLSDPATQTFWVDLVERTAALTTDLFAGASPSTEIRRAVAASWCAAQLLLTATKRATRADASLSVVGLPPQQTRAAFTGTPTSQPPALVAGELAAGLAIAAPSGGWRLEHAVSYLASTGAITLLETVAPRTKPYLDAFRGIFGASTAAVAGTILSNVGAVAPLGGGAPDARRTLQDLTGALRALVESVVDGQAMPAARTALDESPEALLYLDEVLRPGLGFALGACTDVLLDWSSGAVAPTAATEALSGVVLKLLGRTVVVTSDVVTDYVRRETQGVLEKVADEVQGNGLAARFATLSGLPADVAADRAADFLRLVGRTLSPYIEAERREIRNLNFTVLDPIPPAAGRDFIDQLAADSFVPNAEAAGRLLQRTFDLLSERFVAFALGALELLGATFLELLEDALRAAAKAVREWIAKAGRALAEAERRLAELGLEIIAAADAAAEFLDDALGDLASAFSAIGATSRRNALKNRLADSFVDKMEDLLDDNAVYRAIPSDMKSDARESAQAIVRSLANGLAAPVFEVVASVAEGVSEILDDVREAGPTTGLATVVADSILDRVEAAVRDVFGGDDPGFNVGFDFTYSLPEVRLIPPKVVMKTHHVHVGLGRIELPISSFITVLRDVLDATSAFHSALDRAAGKLRSWLEKELESSAKTGEQEDVALEAETLRGDKTATQGAPRDLSLASPTHGAVYGDLVPVRVVLDDASVEFADFARGPARFFAHFNGEEMAADRFTVEPRPAFDMRGTAGFGFVDGGPKSGGGARPGLGRRSVGGTPKRGGASTGAGPRRASLSSSWSSDAVVAKRGSRQSRSGLVRAFDPGARVRGSGAASGRKGKLDSSGTADVRGFLPARFGGKLREVDFERAVDAIPRTTVVLRAELGLDECVVGMNVLSITVVAADGSRLTRTSTFVVEIPVLPPGPGGTRPGAVFPPRRFPVDPKRLKPKAARAPLDAAAKKKLKDAATRSVAAKATDPSARLGAASAVLKERISPKPTERDKS
jgi:hypothetical protein